MAKIKIEATAEPEVIIKVKREETNEAEEDNSQTDTEVPGNSWETSRFPGNDFPENDLPGNDFPVPHAYFSSPLHR